MGLFFISTGDTGVGGATLSAFLKLAYTSLKGCLKNNQYGGVSHLLAIFLKGAMRDPFKK